MATKDREDPEKIARRPLTHLDERGQAKMVDVGPKEETRRVAVASARLRMSREALAAIREGRIPKGDVGAAARLAGIQAAKRTADLIPLCHSLRLDSVSVELGLSEDPEEPAVHILARVEARDRTGVEMEALTAACVAALTVYDMTKAVDRGITIGPIRLEEKQGGRSGRWRRAGGGTDEDDDDDA